MATCKDCIHEKVCVIKAFPDAFENTQWDKAPCDHFKSTADVVPKSEVDNWYQLYHSIKEELKQEKMYHRETENLCDRYCIESQQAKKQVARELLSDLKKAVHDKAVYAYSKEMYPYINLKVFDAVIRDYLNKLEKR